MRILWLSMGPLPGVSIHYNKGVMPTCSWAGNLLSAILRKDATAEFCCLNIGYEPFESFTDGRVRYVYVGRRGKLNYPVGKIPLEVQQEIKQQIFEFDPDIIHVHGTEYYYGRLNEDVYCGKPVVVSLQGIISQYHIHYTGGLSPREVWWTKFNARLLKYGSTLFRDQTFWRETRAEQEQCVFRQQKYFVGRTEWDRNCVEFYNPRARYYVGNETLRDVFYQTRRDPEQISPYTIFCGAAAGYPLKGAHWLIRAVAALKSDFPDIQLRIAASADRLSRKRSLWNRLRDDAYAAYLRKLIHDLDVENQVVALPSLSGEMVARELQNAQLFVLPSLCENSANSIGEAMLVGTPIISTYAGGTPTIIKNGVEGVLVPPSDPHALAGAIRRWFEHPDEAERCVEPARKTALARHNSEVNAARTLEIYKSIISDDRILP